MMAIIALHRHPGVASSIGGFISDARFCFFDVSDKVSRYWSNLKLNFSQDVNKKLFDLQCENVRLKLQADRAESLVLENRELKTLLEMKRGAENKIVFARIIDIFNNDFVRSALINAGKNQDVQVDNFVFNEQGLIGRVIEVSDNWSKVLFIIDANSNIPAKISGQNAILSGDNSNLLQINLVSEGLEEGDIVESSSYGRVFCEKMVIGEVVEKKGKFFVKPRVNFTDLKYVCVGKCQD